MHFLPVVDVVNPFDDVKTNSALLFWAVVLIASRFHVVYHIYYSRLIAPFKQLLSSHIVNCIRSVYTIQTLLLLCLWPLPVDNQKLDPTWNYCGLAVTGVMQMGLHTDSTRWTRSPDQNSSSMLVRLKTWLACFVVSTS